jgi:hypothetical protein
MPSLEASLRNLEKAKTNWRRPRRFRSAQESWVIRRLVWQWLGHRGPKWSARAVGRRLGVSHAYIQKLVREFAEDPSKIKRTAQSSIATFDELNRAQQETRRQKERGCLREPRSWKRSEFLRVPQDVPIWAMPCDSTERPCEVRPWRHTGDGGWMYGA